MIDEATVTDRIEASIEVKRALVDEAAAIAEAARTLAETLDEGNQVLVFGNGGSAADAQHIAAELSGKFYLEDRPGLPAMALTTNSSAVTAISNDFGYPDVFARQVEAFGDAGDAAIGISTSGNSENVLRAIDRADEIGMATVGLAGEGGRLPKVVDHAIGVPSTDTPRIQEAHILVGHILCEHVEDELFG